MLGVTVVWETYLCCFEGRKFVGVRVRNLGGKKVAVFLREVIDHTHF